MRHPLLRRLAWNPIVAAVPLARLWGNSYDSGFPIVRTAGAAFVGLWFALAVYDTLTNHRLLDYLYADEADSDAGGSA
jgi:hypothetical protein